MTADRITAVGLITFLPAYFGAEPWTASKIATSLPRLADGAKPSPPIRARGQVADDVAVHVRRHDHVELLRLLHELMAQLSMMMCQRLDVRILVGDLLEGALQMPSVIFMMFDLVAQATFLRPSDRANSNARRTIFSQPLREMSFRHWATPGVCMCSMPA